jgi:[ribosomal protein S5]-alanine N-acetyltransferase
VQRVHYSALPSFDHPLAALREMRADDLEPMFRVLSQPMVFEHTSWNLGSADDLQAYGAQERSPGSMTRFAIVRRDDGAFIGSAGFHTVSPVNRTAEIAYDLAPEVWGHGIARAACESLTRWAFAHVGLVRVQGTTLVSNMRSQRVLEACAFEREGLLRRYRMVRGTPGDFWMYSRLAS